MRHTPDTIVVLGPTTTGKTRVAAGLARSLGGELVNADKLYLFDGLAVGTGRSDVDGLGLPTHLYGGLDPHTDVPDVGLWLARLDDALRGIHARRRVAIVEGSSFGLASAAAAVAARRHGLVVGLDLVEDPARRARGRRRVAVACAAGVLDETRNALRRGLRDSWPLRRSVVYRTLVDHLDGRVDLDVACERAADGVLAAAAAQRAKFRTLQGVRWFTDDTEVALWAMGEGGRGWRAEGSLLAS